MLRCYADGGLLSRNPSGWGGTASYVIVNEQNEIVSEGSDIIDAATLGDNGFVSGNMAELYALCLCILRTPAGSEVHYYSDSDNALGRVFKEAWNTNVHPGWLRAMRLCAWDHLRTLKSHRYTLLAGHPSRAHLAAGWHSSKNLPVSEWNVYCDSRCAEIGKKWKEERKVNEEG